MKRFFSTILALLITVSSISVVAFADETSTAGSTESKTTAVDASDSNDLFKVYQSYQNYQALYSKVQKGTQEVVIDSSMLTSKTKGVELKENYEGRTGTFVYTNETDTVEYSFNATEGLYNMYIEYYTEPGKDISIERSLKINGEIPFDVAQGFTFNRVWTDNLTKTNKDGELTFDVDVYGNNIRPNQKEINTWTSSYFYDYLGYYPDPLEFYFKDGVNTISLKSVKEPMTIGAIKLVPATKTPTYAEAKAEYDKNGYANYDGKEVIMEAEYPTQKSDQTLYPTADVSTSSTSARDADVSAYKMHINEIGGTSWEYAQQSITWTVSDKTKPGLYAINFKARKNLYQGMISSRKLYINNQIPFAEASAIAFSYSKDWMFVTPKTEDGEQCLVYLKPGDTITLETTLGEMGSLIRDADNSLAEINSIYRQILMITGSSPDKYRDYQLKDLIPDVIKDMKVQADQIDAIVNGIVALTGKKGSDLASLDTMSRQLKKMSKNPDIISKQLAYFKTNIGSYGTWLNTANYTPIELDYISLSAPSSKIQKANVNVFKSLKYSVDSFVASFVVDYNSIGNLTKSTDSEDTVTVWIATGRDQFQTLRSMINNSYTAKTGNQINLELVNAGALLSAVVAGIGPDVILGQAQNEPINFALRNAVYSLSNFKDVNEVTSRFSSEAMVPYYFNNGKTNDLYALPETQDFSVLFYRKDILSDLNIAIPKTWDELINSIVVLNKNNMEFGLPVAVGTFYTFLLQNGGQMYSNDKKSTDLQTDAATVAFKEWTNFFTNYDLPLEFDFQNRFRTGEMPLGIANYTLYNTLAVAAPEIRGLWGFTSVPGTLQKDGTLDRSDTLSTTCSFILDNTKKPDLCWDFLKWWTSADAQSEYGKQLECILGPSARYNTANTEAFESLPWSADEISAIETQLVECKSIPEIAGSYFITRHITNAFRKVIYKSKDPKDTLYDYSNVIDNEITSKREEFGLPINKK